MIGARHDCLAAMGRHRGRDVGSVGGDGDAPDAGGLSPPQDMNDHRQTADIQQWFAGKSSRGHAGGYQHEGAGLGHRSGESGKLAQL